MDQSQPTRPPLRDRVQPPLAVTPLAGTAGLVWRPAVKADVPAIHALERLVGPIDHPGYVVSPEEIEHDLVREGVDLSRDTALGFDADGELVAFGSTVLMPVVGDIVKVAVDGTVHPARRGEGIGTALMRWHEERGRQLLATVDSSDPAWLFSFADERATARIALHEEWGYDLRRWWFELTRDLSAEIADVPLDPGLRLETFSLELSERTRLARNAVFRDHWGSQDTLAPDWDAARALPHARHDLSFVAVDPATDEVAAFVLTEVNEEEWAAAGHSFAYVSYVGVRREWRGRRVAQALLSHAMRAYRAEGLSHATLDVDSESPTGATGLYANLGFTQVNRSVSLVKDL